VRPIPVNRSALQSAGRRWRLVWPQLPHLPWRWRVLALLTGSGAGWVLLVEGGVWAAQVLSLQHPAPWLVDLLARAFGLYLILASARTLLATSGLTQDAAAPRLVRLHATIIQLAGLSLLALLVVLGAVLVALGWLALVALGDDRRARRWLRAGRRALTLSFLAE
jgi:hypothetical protein